MSAILIPILISLGAFAMIFGLRYLSNKERMAMIERGMAPVQPQKRSRPLQTLKWGLIVCGVGLGLLLSFYLTNYVLMTSDEKAPAIYFGLIAIFGGLGLVISYVFERRYEEKEKTNQPN
ncbi:MAG TPA: DUF6249 domain-containing protein [Chitinophagales bacterium]|nr:DUF6249 domain-containing protein [Chitinophagales bacterium]